MRAGVLVLTACGLVFGQSPGAPNHTNGNTTRTQTIHVGEPPTNHPGGNPGRTTGKTGNKSPFARTAPSPGTTPAAPPPEPGCAVSAGAPDGVSVRAATAPSKIGSYTVGYSGGTAVVGNITVAGDAAQTEILCVLSTIAQAPSGATLLNDIQSEAGRRQMAVAIVKPNAGDPGPHTRPGSASDWDWLKAQPASLSPVWAGQPQRPRTSAGLPDWNADATVGGPIAGWEVFIAGKMGNRGTGIGSTIFFAPTMFPLDVMGVKQSTTAGADVGLVHELIHALRHLRGVADRTPAFKAGSTTIADGTWMMVDEREVIGGPGVPANWLTENRYRAEVGVAARNCVAPGCF